MRTAVVAGVLVLLTVGGCPVDQGGSTSAVTAVLAITQTEGDAPLTVTVSALGSSSKNEGDLTYLWDFGDGATSDKGSLTHTYSQPGLYELRLHVTDAAGEADDAGEDVQVRGKSAVAVIVADVTSGAKPLQVHFDGTKSKSDDDTIRDYYWDFGDGESSRAAAPTHVFRSQGQFEVELRVVTAGGLEATTTTTITVGTATASLQFNGLSFATLRLNSTQSLDACTLEAWVKAESEGGTVATLGSGGVTVEVVPGSNSIRMRVNGTEVTAAASNLSGAWRHVAVAYQRTASGSGGSEGGTPSSGTGTCTLYLDGAPLTSTNATQTLSVDRITLGNGLRGKIAEVHFWSQARTDSQILSDKGRRITTAEAGLLGTWALSEGSGQTLRNGVGGTSGTLGASDAVEDTDPAWSPEGPPL